MFDGGTKGLSVSDKFTDWRSRASLPAAEGATAVFRSPRDREVRGESKHHRLLLSAPEGPRVDRSGIVVKHVIVSTADRRIDEVTRQSTSGTRTARRFSIPRGLKNTETRKVKAPLLLPALVNPAEGFASILFTNRLTIIGVATMKLKDLQMISKHTVVKYARLLVGGGALFFAATAQAAFSPLARVDAIQQGRSSSFSGVTFVHLQGVSCRGRSDGYFVLPSDTQQSKQIELLLSSISSSRVVTINHNPATCIASDVGLCLTAFVSAC